MPFQDDNDIGRPRGPRKFFPRRGAAAWVDIAGAVLVGNAIYFLLLSPHLPEEWRHQPFLLDRGVVLDFVLCLALYGLARLFHRLV